uniref:Uncharacterized protein n=1 Tax=Lygus hesperus TaxID=30085 RepID=A0A0A9ZE53_LYGHE
MPTLTTASTASNTEIFEKPTPTTAVSNIWLPGYLVQSAGSIHTIEDIEDTTELVEPVTIGRHVKDTTGSTEPVHSERCSTVVTAAAAHTMTDISIEMEEVDELVSPVVPTSSVAGSNILSVRTSIDNEYNSSSCAGNLWNASSSYSSCSYTNATVVESKHETTTNIATVSSSDLRQLSSMVKHGTSNPASAPTPSPQRKKLIQVSLQGLLHPGNP